MAATARNFQQIVNFLQLNAARAADTNTKEERKKSCFHASLRQHTSGLTTPRANWSTLVTHRQDTVVAFAYKLKSKMRCKKTRTPPPRQAQQSATTPLHRHALQTFGLAVGATVLWLQQIIPHPVNPGFLTVRYDLPKRPLTLCSEQREQKQKCLTLVGPIADNIQPRPNIPSLSTQYCETPENQQSLFADTQFWPPYTQGRLRQAATLPTCFIVTTAHGRTIQIAHRRSQPLPPSAQPQRRAGTT